MRGKNKYPCRSRKFTLIKDDEFGGLKNDFKWEQGNKIFKICYSDFRCLVDKFVLQNLEQKDKKNDDLNKSFSEFIHKRVKFRRCLKCSIDFLSIDIGHRRCAECCLHDPEPFISYTSWGEIVL